MDKITKTKSVSIYQNFWYSISFGNAELVGIDHPYPSYVVICSLDNRRNVKDM